MTIRQKLAIGTIGLMAMMVVVIVSVVWVVGNQYNRRQANRARAVLTQYFRASADEIAGKNRVVDQEIQMLIRRLRGGPSPTNRK